MTPVSVVILAFLVAGAVFVLWKKWDDRLVRGLSRVNKAWEDLDRAVLERVAALQSMHEALEKAGYVPEGHPRLLQTVTALREAEGPRARAAADLDVEAVLHAIYRGLPRERLESIRAAQNRLAQADEERDIARTQYNDLSLSLALLVRRFPYRSIARRRRLVPPEPFLLPGEEADYVRRHLGRA